MDYISTLYDRWNAGVRSDTRLTVSEWADKHRVLTGVSAAEPGQWRTDRTPYLREVMDALSATSPYREVVGIKGVQLGFTECGCNWIGYTAHHVPGPMMMIMPSLDLIRLFSQQRLAPMIAGTPALRQRIRSAREQDSGNKILTKNFPGGILQMVGCGSGPSLRSMPVRFLYMDEVDAFKAEVGADGDPVAVAEARTSTFGHSKKIFKISTPLIRGASRIEADFLKTDQRYYFVPCPHCLHKQTLKFPSLRWEKGRYNTVHYICEGCGAAIYERHKDFMLAGGEWRATAESTSPDIVGFHLSSLYSPIGWMSWAEIAKKFELAQGNPKEMRSFVNLILGETWADRGEAPDWERLHERRDPLRQMGIVPRAASMLTAGIDVQDDRLEASVWAWGPNFESWLVDHIVMDGNPGSPQVWGAADAFMARSWPLEDGTGSMRIAKAAIDSGGHHTQAVYSWARKQNQSQLMIVKGMDSPGRVQAVTGPSSIDLDVNGKKYKKAVKLWIVSVSMLKSETYQWLKTPRPPDDVLAESGFPRGYIHFPAGTSAEFFKQLCSEELVASRDRLNRVKMEWRVNGRNEALDCRVYARAALYILGADTYGGSDAFWRAGQDLVVKAEKPPQPRRQAAQNQHSASWLGNFGSYR